MDFDKTFDSRIRLAAFKFLEETTLLKGKLFSRPTLLEGFKFDNTRIPLISPQGIFKPKVLKFPLSITTIPPSEKRPKPYDDNFNEENLNIVTKAPNHQDNVGLRKAMELQLPLIYFYGLAPNKYLPCWPVYVVGDDTKNSTFKGAIG